MRAAAATKERPAAMTVAGRLDVRGAGERTVVTLDGRNLARYIRRRHLDGESVVLHIVMDDEGDD